jgi:hypothetical protein
VPFHLGGHKPKAILPEKRPSSLPHRIFLAAAGLILLVAGTGRLSNGIHFVINSRGMPAFSGALAATGVVFILVAATPTRWMEKAVDWFVSKDREAGIPGRSHR